MVSGFLTSPWDQVRMSSAVARPIRRSSKKLTSSTLFLPSLGCVQSNKRLERSGRSDLFDTARLAPGQIDTELLRSTEDVLVGVAHLDGHPVAGEHLDVEAQRLHLLEQHLERLGDAG